MVERRDDPAVERPGRLEGHRDAGSCVRPAFSEDSDRQADRQADDRDATGAYIDITVAEQVCGFPQGQSQAAASRKTDAAPLLP